MITPVSSTQLPQRKPAELHTLCIFQKSPQHTRKQMLYNQRLRGRAEVLAALTRAH